jgi:hypothetical protein
LQNAVVLGAWQCGQESILKKTSIRQATATVLVRAAWLLL